MTDRTTDIWGVVLAAGSGARFGGQKQFASVAGHRLVDLALRTVTRMCDHVVLVLPAEVTWNGSPVDAIAEGGRDRTASVRHALRRIPLHAEIIVVHQAANPLASAATLEAVIAAVQRGADAAVPGLKLPDVVRRVADGFVVEDVGRDDLVMIQSPVAFRADVLRAAHATGATAIEDTALVAAQGGSIAVVPGDPLNLHVTTPAQLGMVGHLVHTRGEHPQRDQS